MHLYSAEVRTGMRDKGGTWQWPDFACFHGLNCLLNIIFIVIFLSAFRFWPTRLYHKKKTLNPILCWRKHSAWTDIKSPRCRKTVDFFEIFCCNSNNSCSAAHAAFLLCLDFSPPALSSEVHSNSEGQIFQIIFYNSHRCLLFAVSLYLS